MAEGIKSWICRQPCQSISKITSKPLTNVCLKHVKNRFELVKIAADRTRQLMRGKEAKVDWDNDKPTVVALREIAEGYTNFEQQEEPALDAYVATDATKKKTKVVITAENISDEEE